MILKGYFDEEGVLRHCECEGRILCDVEMYHAACLITNTDEDWIFDNFLAHVVTDYSDTGSIIHKYCEACGDQLDRMEIVLEEEADEGILR